jgi:hypothetical protein
MKTKDEIKSAHKVGRPEVVITEQDWKIINQSLMSGCDGASIARHFGMHPDTFYTKVVEKYGELYNISLFSDYSKAKRIEGDNLIRNKQFDRANSGSDTMLIWLGKQRLGQKEKVENDIHFSEPITGVIIKKDED